MSLTCFLLHYPTAIKTKCFPKYSGCKVHKVSTTEEYLLLVYPTPTKRQKIIEITAIPESNCTFPYNYLVTTSSQLPTYRHEPPRKHSNKNVKPLTHLRQADFRAVTGGLYRTLELVHRDILIRDYWRFRLHAFKLQKAICTKRYTSLKTLYS
jgi:hypothetical protein